MKSYVIMDYESPKSCDLCRFNINGKCLMAKTGEGPTWEGLVRPYFCPICLCPEELEQIIDDWKYRRRGEQVDVEALKQELESAQDDSKYWHDAFVKQCGITADLKSVIIKQALKINEMEDAFEDERE